MKKRMLEIGDISGTLCCGVVILNYNSHNLTVTLAEKLANYKSIDKICVVDNCSKDEFSGEFNHHKIHYIKNSKNLGYSAGNNVGLKYLINECNCEFVFIANPDVEFDDNTICQMCNQMQKEDGLAIIATKRYGYRGEKIHQYFDFPTFRVSIKNCFAIIRKNFRRDRHITQNNEIDNSKEVFYVDAVPGAFFGMRSSFLLKNNFLYEGIFLYGEEIILGRQARNLGYKVGIINTGEYYHNHIQKRFSESNRKMFWYDRCSLIKYYQLFRLLKWYQMIALKIAILLGTLEYNCMYLFYTTVKHFRQSIG